MARPLARRRTRQPDELALVRTQGGRGRVRRRDARRRRLGEIASAVGAQETLDQYVADTWATTHAVTLARSTAKTSAGLYDLHISPYLGQLKLVELTPEVIARWQASNRERRSAR